MNVGLPSMIVTWASAVCSMAFTSSRIRCLYSSVPGRVSMYPSVMVGVVSRCSHRWFSLVVWACPTPKFSSLPWLKEFIAAKAESPAPVDIVVSTRGRALIGI